MNNEKKFSLIYGVMLGDGCLSNYKSQGKLKYCISITCSYKDDQEFIKLIHPIIESLRNKKIRIKQRPKKGTVEINFLDKNLFKKFKDFGFPIGKKGKNLKIPDYFYKKKLLKYLVQGFFATDGSLVLTKNPNKLYPRLEAHCIHKILINQIKDYLISQGLEGNTYLCKRKKIDPRFKTVQKKYRFQFNGKNNLIQFNNKIGFINLKHNNKYEFFMATLGVEPRTSCS